MDNDLKWASQKTIILQVGIMKLCSIEQVNDREELIKKINKLEKEISEIQQGIIHNSSKNVDNKAQNLIKNANIEKKMENNLKENKNRTNSLENFKKVDTWPSIVNNLKQNGKIMLYTNLINTNARVLNDMMVGIEFPNGLTSFGKAILEKPENLSELTKLVSMECGKDMVVKLLDENNLPKIVQKNSIDNITNNIDMPINIIEE